MGLFSFFAITGKILPFRGHKRQYIPSYLLPACISSLVSNLPSRSNGLGWIVDVPSGVRKGSTDSAPMGSPVPAIVRQIAWELEQSLVT
jgi:hypothetical protein